jgi:DNA-directed RNA polymerase subunit RPC12/RpoP
MNSKGMPNFATAVEVADRPQGKWVTEYNGNGWNDYWNYTCSNCGKKYERADAVLYYARYCPNCGARMKGADDEADNN